MGSYLSSEPQPPAERAALAKEIHTLVAENPVVMFSKTWCGFCSQAKSLFMKLAVTPRVVELNQRDDGSHMQSVLAEMTGRSTVPNIWINGRYFGGCNDAMDAYASGELQKQVSGGSSKL